MEKINEAFKTSFRFDELNKTKNIDEKYKYCIRHLGPCMGQGSSRAVFDFTDDVVLKLAFSDAGIEQNKTEYQLSKHENVVVKCFEVAPDFSWILQENVLPAEEEDFQECLGLDFVDVQQFVVFCYKTYGKRNCPYLEMDYDDVKFYLNKSENAWWYQGLHKYMRDNELPYGDLIRISSYGMVKRNGKPQIVILDSGLTEEVLNKYYRKKQMNEMMLSENRESKNINIARKYLMQRGKSQSLAQEILGNIRHDIPNSRLAGCKFLTGVCRMYLDGDLTNGKDIMNLNKTLKYVATEAHVNEYDYNLNNLSAEEIISRFETTAKQDLESELERSNNRQFAEQSNYQIVRIPDYETADEYSKYTDWCVTRGEENYDSYTNGGEGIFYFCLQNGFQNVQPYTGENTPLDEYGLSMIAVSVNSDGSCNTITCRWNHANGGNDNIMTPEQLEDVINLPFYKTFKPRTREEIIEASQNKADWILSYLNDESGQGEEECMNPYNVNGEELLVWHGVGGYYDSALSGDVILRKGENGYELAYNYAFPETVVRIVPSKDMKCGFYVVCGNGLYKHNDYTFHYLFNTDTMSFIGDRSGDDSMVFGNPPCVGFFNAGKFTIMNMNGEKIFQTKAFCGMRDIYGHNFNPSLKQSTFIVAANHNMTLVKVFNFSNNGIEPLFNGEDVGYSVDLTIKEAHVAIFTPQSSGVSYVYEGPLNRPCPLNPVNAYYGIRGQNGMHQAFVMKDNRYYVWDVAGSFAGTEYREVPVEHIKESLRGDMYFMNHWKGKLTQPTAYEQLPLEENVSIKPFEPKDELNPKFWVNNKLNSKVRMRLLDIADDFVKTLNIRWVKPEDIVLTGSIANYNWTKYSDVDIHIIMDFKKVYKKTDFVKNYFDSKKEEWNGTHEGLKIYGFNVELSVEDLNTPAQSSGVYSLEKNDWIKEPKDLSDAKMNKEYIESTAENYIEKIDDIERRIKKEKDAKKVEILSNKMVSLFNKLKGLRKEGLKSKSKEMSSGNIIWKILRAEGYIEKIWKVVNYNYDRRMSIRESKRLSISPITINETHMQNLYHFMSPNSLFRALSSGKLELNDSESSFHPNYKYFLSTTRNRNSVQGFPFMCSDYGIGGTKHNIAFEDIIIRAELDGEALRNFGKVKPFDWMYHETQNDWKYGGYDRHNGKQDSLQSDDEIERKHQPWSQAEERLMTNNSEIPFNTKTVKKIDVYINPEKCNDDEMQWIPKIKKLEEDGIVTIYYDRNKFNTQSSLNEGSNPGIGNVYLNSWLGRFKTALKTNAITTPQLHDAMRKLGVRQVTPGVYRQADLLSVLSNLKELKIALGIEAPAFTNPAPININSVQSKAEYPIIDYTPPASKMGNFVNMDDVSKLNEGCWGPLPTQSDDALDRRGEFIIDTLTDLSNRIKKAPDKDAVYHEIGNAIIYLVKMHGWYTKGDLIDSGLDIIIRKRGREIQYKPDWIDSYTEDCRSQMIGILNNIITIYENVVNEGAFDSDDYKKEGDDGHYENLFTGGKGLEDLKPKKCIAAPDKKEDKLDEAVTGKDNKQATALYVYVMDKKDGEWHLLCARRANVEGDSESGKWNPPMGHLHRGEEHINGAIRECLEESGIDFTSYKSKIKLMDSHRWGDNFRLIIKDRYTGGFKPGDGDEENDKFIWLPVSKISTKEWAYTCGENAERYKPKTVKLNEEQYKLIKESVSNDTIRLYHGVSAKNMEFNLENGGFTPRVCAEGGPKAVYLSEKQYGYEFTFSFDIPKSLMGKILIQQTTVDYTFDNFISFNDFNCQLVKTSFYEHGDGFSVGINLKNIDMCKKQFRFMPEIYKSFNERMKQYPLVYGTFVKPVLSEMGVLDNLNESKHTVVIREEQLKNIKSIKKEN